MEDAAHVNSLQHVIYLAPFPSFAAMLLVVGGSVLLGRPQGRWVGKGLAGPEQWPL